VKPDSIPDQMDGSVFALADILLTTSFGQDDDMLTHGRWSPLYEEN